MFSFGFPVSSSFVSFRLFMMKVMRDGIIDEDVHGAIKVTDICFKDVWVEYTALLVGDRRSTLLCPTGRSRILPMRRVYIKLEEIVTLRSPVLYSTQAANGLADSTQLGVSTMDLTLRQLPLLRTGIQGPYAWLCLRIFLARTTWNRLVHRFP